jgi:hypothetical protein
VCGQHAAGGGGEPVALAGGDELLHGLAMGSQAGSKDLPIPRADHDAAAIASELVGEVLGIADAKDLRRRVEAEAPGRKGDRGHQGFEMPRWQVDDGAYHIDFIEVIFHPTSGRRLIGSFDGSRVE